MQERQKYILKSVISNYNGTSKEELVTKLKISERTLLQDISIINVELDHFNLFLNVSKSYVSIPFSMKDAYIKAYASMTQEDTLENMISSKEDRPYLIMLYLLDKNTFISMEDVSFDLYISKSTVFNAVNELIRSFSFPGKSELIISNLGLKLEASEKEKRIILMQILSSKISLKVSNRFVKYALSDKTIEIKDNVISSFQEFLQDINLTVSTVEMYQAMIYTLIVLDRNDKNGEVELVEKESSILIYQEKLKKRGLDIRLEDLIYIEELIKTSSQVLEHQRISENILNQFEKRMRQLYNLSDTENYEFSGLNDHLISILFSDEEHTSSSVFAQSYVKKYAASMLYANLLKTIIEEELNQILSDSNTLYLAIHIQSLIKRSINSMNTLLIYEASYGVNQHIMSGLSSHYGHNYRFIQVYNLWTIEKVLEYENVDLIISTEGILSTFKQIPTLVIEPIINQETYLKIHEVLYSGDDKVETVRDDFLHFDTSIKELKNETKEKIELTGFVDLSCIEIYTAFSDSNKIIYNPNGKKTFLYLYPRGTSFNQINKHINYIGETFSSEKQSK